MLNIAVVLFETSNGQLRGNVVSEEGPTTLLAARPHNAMVNAAREAAQELVDKGPHSEARVWQLQTTEADAPTWTAASTPPRWSATSAPTPTAATCSPPADPAPSRSTFEPRRTRRRGFRAYPKHQKPIDD
ncbi:hypothetical protein L3Q67_45055 (plasmid) [Saccharothrix sp. AJ9571]|nr:hypothetical protein L3Q67_45055 [Saccharothrix sp. AJ9571]